ncbi:MAG: phosphonate metabolism protein/1,5-bisphosphokinase (PRPP-forming) PhnN [Pseudomonadota bacterium]
MNGCLILVVGPSGVGKDTLMRGAQRQLAADHLIQFPKRLITRTSDPQHEDHETLSEAAFERLCATGAAPLHWRAHGHGYAVPASVLDTVNAGASCVVNGSRGVLDQAALAFPRAYAILIQLDRQNLENRIERRGRETGTAVQERLNRRVTDVAGRTGVHTLNNSGTVEEGTVKLVNLIRACADGALAAL